jgi:hypothetical protein
VEPQGVEAVPEAALKLVRAHMPSSNEGAWGWGWSPNDFADCDSEDDHDCDRRQDEDHHPPRRLARRLGETWVLQMIERRKHRWASIRSAARRGEPARARPGASVDGARADRAHGDRERNLGRGRRRPAVRTESARGRE